MQQGYIRLYRCILDNGWSRDPDYMALWVYCLLRGNYKESIVEMKYGSVVHLRAGQFITSREQISVNTGIQESKVERILKTFKSEQQIEQRNCGKFRIITILNWDKYQAREHQNEQQMNNRRTTDEQRVNTDKEVKEVKKEKNNTCSEFFEKLWKAYPNKDGKKAALRHYLSSVKTEKEMAEIDYALGNYLEHLKDNPWKQPKNGDTWFNNWRDWIPEGLNTDDAA